MKDGLSWSLNLISRNFVSYFTTPNAISSANASGSGRALNLLPSYSLSETMLTVTPSTCIAYYNNFFQHFLYAPTITPSHVMELSPQV